jgi:ribonuclease E
VTAPTPEPVTAPTPEPVATAPAPETAPTQASTDNKAEDILAMIRARQQK